MYNIRSAAPKDAEAILEIYAPFVKHSFVTFEEEVPPVSAFQARIAQTLEKYPFLVCTDDETVVGYAYASSFRSRAAYNWDAELSVYMSPAHGGKGLGKRLYAALLALLERQNIVNVYGCLALPNHQSERLHEAMDFRRLGVFPKTGYKDGKWLDILWYDKVISPQTVPPAPFIPFSKLEPDAVKTVLEHCTEA